MMSVLVLSGCSRKAEEVAVTAAPTTERVVVTTEAETEPAESEPESTERVAVDGMIRSYLTAVSYTHLDVYKRQDQINSLCDKWDR